MRKPLDFWLVLYGISLALMLASGYMLFARASRVADAWAMHGIAGIDQERSAWLLVGAWLLPLLSAYLLFLTTKHLGDKAMLRLGVVWTCCLGFITIAVATMPAAAAAQLSSGLTDWWAKVNLATEPGFMGLWVPVPWLLWLLYGYQQYNARTRKAKRPKVTRALR